MATITNHFILFQYQDNNKWITESKKKHSSKKDAFETMENLAYKYFNEGYDCTPEKGDFRTFKPNTIYTFKSKEKTIRLVYTALKHKLLR